MLTIKGRYSSLRQFSFDLGYSPREKTDEQSTHTLAIESKSLIKHEKPHEFNDKELLERINELEEENENLRLENLLFSRYLLRITTSKRIETFREYEDETDIIHETLDQTKVIDSARQILLKKSPSYTRDGTPLWTKRSINLLAPTDIQYISPIDQERFFIAAYEVEQTRLDWQRMKAHELAVIDNLKVLYQNIKSDEDAQNSLNLGLQRRIDRYRTLIGEEKFNSPYLSVPGELFVSRVHKRIDARISSIGVFLVNTELLRSRIEHTDLRIRQVDDIVATISEVDLESVIQMKKNRTKELKEIKKKYILEKSSYYPLLNHSKELKKNLNEQEIKINDIEKQFEILQNNFEQTIIDINYIKQENNKILKQNNILKDRIDNTVKVPTISNYAHIIEQRKILQHDIDIWTQRVNIAETLLSQLKRQNKPSKILPPLQPSTSIN
ncbi:unnamed protein product [Rotaria sordida]|uniref:DUF4201 domain-containing protein n=1 Tax=Rotaria sordida TaxID=392033 RepID=A0A816CEJ9_9BILA|nr:unnamed protein product [Rotaria sordida]CAF1498140.1 unnamed protein product [Rotaria sordida]CAF1620360.1 unnamed protein product [Rotaria sordida]CAF3927348.1 unnamed protein product [Rotaria sordida]